MVNSPLKWMKFISLYCDFLCFVELNSFLRCLVKLTATCFSIFVYEFTLQRDWYFGVNGSESRPDWFSTKCSFIIFTHFLVPQVHHCWFAMAWNDLSGSQLYRSGGLSSILWLLLPISTWSYSSNIILCSCFHHSWVWLMFVFEVDMCSVFLFCNG